MANSDKLSSNDTSTQKISTSQLAKQHEVDGKTLFNLFVEHGYLKDEGPDSECRWIITDKGKVIGGEYKDSAKYGRYVVWPKDINLKSLNARVEKYHSNITSTQIGKSLGISSRKVNHILSELGFITKSIKGWTLTKHGQANGGLQDEDKRTGVPYVRWPDKIIDLPIFKQAVTSLEDYIEQPDNLDTSDHRKKYKAEIRTTDGHYVRSKAEFMIDNQLYLFGVVHAYEKRLPIEEDCYSDFYIPSQKVYIEYWGLENDPKYQARKKAKLAIYEKYGFNLIQLEDSDIQNIEDVLAKHLLKFNIEVN